MSSGYAEHLRATCVLWDERTRWWLSAISRCQGDKCISTAGDYAAAARSAGGTAIRGLALCADLRLSARSGCGGPWCWADRASVATCPEVLGSSNGYRQRGSRGKETPGPQVWGGLRY